MLLKKRKERCKGGREGQKDRGRREKERERKLKFLTSNYVVENEQIWTLCEP